MTQSCIFASLLCLDLQHSCGILPDGQRLNGLQLPKLPEPPGCLEHSGEAAPRDFSVRQRLQLTMETASHVTFPVS